MDGMNMTNDENAKGIRDDLQMTENALGRALRRLDAIEASGQVVGDALLHLKAYRQILKGARHSVQGGHKGLEVLAGQTGTKFGGK